MIEKHEELLMCDKCYGLIKDDLGVKYLKHNSDLKLCDCKECHRATAIKIDKNIFGIVQALNLKGYYTEGSCEGYGKYGVRIAFTILNKDFKLTTKKIPDGFVLTKTMLYSTTLYKTQKEKREDEKRILYWIKNSLGDVR